MKTKNFKIIFLMVMATCLSLKLYSQPGTLILNFSADNNGTPVSLESVWINNLTQNCDTTLYPPDFTLVIDTVLTGIINVGSSGNDFTVSQNFPNPFKDQTTISINLPEKANIEISVSNLLGQQITKFSGQLSDGKNTFIFNRGNESVYILSVRNKMEIRTIRMLSSGNHVSGDCILRYQGNEDLESFKSVQIKNYFDFDAGDQLLFAGHISSEESGILDSPTSNQNYMFQFATNIPCQGLDSLFFDGRYYHTIQIFSQCWMKENLEAGVMIMGSQSQTNNGIIEKYCYANSLNYCSTVGGLYLWDELMQYNSTQGSQGICPVGWHIPTDEEWKILEGATDSQYSIGHNVWNSNTYRGFDTGKNLKSSSGWYSNGNGIDLYGFGAVGAGYWWQNGFFEKTMDGFYGSSTTTYDLLPIIHAMNFNTDKVARSPVEEIVGYSVRCMKDQ